MSISLPSHSNPSNVANQFLNHGRNSEATEDSPNLLNADQENHRSVRQKRQIRIELEKKISTNRFSSVTSVKPRTVPLVAHNPRTSTSRSYDDRNLGTITREVFIQKYRQVGEQINNNIPRSGIHRPDFLKIPQFPGGFLTVPQKVDEFLNKVKQLFDRTVSERWAPWRLEYEMTALWEDHIWQHVEVKKGGSREPRLHALRDLKTRLEQNHNAQLRAAWNAQLTQQHTQEIRDLEQSWNREKENVKIFDAVQVREEVSRAGLTASPQWPQWERNWQQEEQAWKNFVKAEWENLLREFQKRDREVLGFSATVDQVNAENRWRHAKRDELNQKLTQRRNQKVQSLQQALNQLAAAERIRLQKERAEREVREWEQQWERTKESVVLINNGVQLRENASRTGLTASPQWPQWERNWQQEEQAWKSLVRTENLNLLKEFHKRDRELSFSTTEAVNAENQWRQAKRDELNQKLSQIQAQKTQTLQAGLNQLEAAERIRLQKEKAEREVREWEQQWEQTKESVVLINNKAELRETASRTGLTTSPDWPQWEQHWQQEEQAWKSLVREENLNLLKEFHKRDRELSFSTTEAVNAENQLRQAKREELNRKIAQMHTQKVQSLQERLNQLVAADQEIRDYGKIVQFFADAARDVVTDYLAILARGEAEISVRIQGEGAATEISQTTTRSETTSISNG